MSPALAALIEVARERERAQTQFYRRAAAEAELHERPDWSERLNALHADEQHHLSRLTARLLEAGHTPVDHMPPRTAVDLDAWESVARTRELDEIAWYEEALESPELDDSTRALFEEILESERHHARELGGKWMPA